MVVNQRSIARLLNYNSQLCSKMILRGCEFYLQTQNTDVYLDSFHTV